MKTKTRSVLMLSGVLGIALLGVSGPASAHSNVDFSVSIGVPGVVYEPAYVPPPPVMYAPRSVYLPAPVYYTPGYYGYGPRWRERHDEEWDDDDRHEHHWRHGREDDD